MDMANISFKMQTPHPFDERIFIANIEESFKKKPTKALSINPDGVATVEEYRHSYKQAYLNFHPEQGIVGIQGLNYADVSEGFNILHNILMDRLKLDFKIVKYLEISIKGRYQPNIKPLKRLARIYKDETMQFFKDLFSCEDETPMSLRICSANSIDEEISFREIADWHEFRIEPMILNPNFYFWEIVYRKAKWENVIDFWKDLPAKIENLFVEFDQNDGDAPNHA
jgi:hypothetical protein